MSEYGPTSDEPDETKLYKIVPMKPYLEPEPQPTDTSHWVLRELEWAALSLKKIWRDITRRVDD